MIKEQRLIDAIALIGKARRMETTDNNGIPVDTFAIPVMAIEDAPTVDAVAVVHAFWTGDEPGEWQCSHCGEYAADGGFEQTKYCPNCGAKMDGGIDK